MNINVGRTFFKCVNLVLKVIKVQIKRIIREKSLASVAIAFPATRVSPIK